MFKDILKNDFYCTDQKKKKKEESVAKKKEMHSFLEQHEGEQNNFE